MTGMRDVGGQNDPRTARLLDSLKCDLSVKESRLEHASKIIDCEKKKITVVAKDSKAVLNSLLNEIQETRDAGARETTWLKYALSKCDVDQHGLERDRMHDSIKYNAAVDSLAQQKQLIRHLTRYIDAERHVNRDVVGQNIVLMREIEHMADVIQKKSNQLKKGRSMLQSLMKEIDIKDDVLRSTQNQLLLTQSRYDEQMMQSQQTSGAASNGAFLESLMKEHGLTKEQIISYVKEYKEMDHNAIRAQDKKVASLEKKVVTLQNTCKEQERKRKQAEKTVKQQQKELDAKEKRIKTLEDSLKMQEEMTPSAPKAVTRAMEAVGNIMAELGGTSPSIVDAKNSPNVIDNLRIDTGDTSIVSASESTGRGSVSRRTIADKMGACATHEKQSRPAATAEPSNEADVSIWNPDSDKLNSDKENPSKVLSFTTDGKKATSTMPSKGIGTKRKLLSVSSHNRNQPLMGVTKKNTGFSIPKLNQ